MIPSSSYISREIVEIDDALRKTLDTKVKLIRQPLQDMINSGGKRLRPMMVLTCAHFGPSYDFKKVKPLAVAVELIHMATLVHDDVIDDSPTRRGKPSLQAQLGKDVAVFAGDFIFSKVFELLASTDHHQLLYHSSKILYKIFEGEIQQREELFNTEITYKNYIYRIKRKTAMLFSLSCQLGAVSSKASPMTMRYLNIYGTNVGIAFQMVDDLLDMTGDEKTLGKPPGADLREGVITLPAIYALRHSHHKEQLKYLLEKENYTQEDVDRAIDIIRMSGGLEYTEKMSKRYITKAKKALKALPEIPVKKVLSDIADYVISRER